jgi:DNA modification methylase
MLNPYYDHIGPSRIQDNQSYWSERRQDQSSSKSSLESPVEVSHLPPIEQLTGNAFFRLTSNNTTPKYTHFLFKFPARFYVPIVRWALDQYAAVPRKTVVLDPFNGSGTVQVEASARGMKSVGMDIDPVATFIARAKVIPLRKKTLERELSRLEHKLQSLARTADEYGRRLRPQDDISAEEFDQESNGLSIPSLLNLQHWFRRYVIIDLARIRLAIEEQISDSAYRNFFLAVFAACIRPCSNADPAPVSGVEYTKLMQERDRKGRYINPFSVFQERAKVAVEAMGEYREACRRDHLAVTLNCSTLNMEGELQAALPQQEINLIITSPPYLNAVDYHRRHRLEAFWLGLTDSDEAYLASYHSYIGRHRVKRCDHPAAESLDVPKLNKLLADIEQDDPERAMIIRAYFVSMDRVVQQIAGILPRGGRALIAIGNSITGQSNKRRYIETHAFLHELAQNRGLTIEKEFSYEIRNRHMNFSRHNSANINREWLLVFTRR